MIGDRIKMLRELSGFTQEELGKKVGLTRSGVHSWETGISCPSAQGLIELSKIFNVTTDYILEISHEESIDISSLNGREKKLIFEMMNYFNSKE